MNDRILLVDDEEGIRKVLGISLSDIGYDVFTVENGQQALDIFNAKKPAIVITDIKMPGMDGIQILEAIKNEAPDTEVIMITGHGDMDLAIKSLKHGATDFITKPINDDALEIALKRANERISMRNQIQNYTENLEEMVREKSARVIELERQAAVGQAVEGLSTAIRDIAVDLEPGPTGIKYFNEMPCFVSIHNRHLEVIASNQLYLDRLGNKVGRSSWEIYLDQTSEHHECPVEKTFETGTGQRSNEIVEYQTGEAVRVVVHTAPIRNREDQVELVVEIAADVSEIERLQKELRTSQQRYEQLFNEVPCYISVQDKAFRLKATNRRFKEDFGENVESHCYEIYKHRNEPCTDCPVAKTFMDGQSHHSEMVVTSKTWEKYNVLIWTAPIRDAYGEIIQVMEMMTNITEIRRLQDHLSSLGLLIGSISHGIKGLLTGLDGGMYLLSSGFAKQSEEQVKEGWETVKLMVERIRKMVLNILYYAKDRELNWEEVDVHTFAIDVAHSIEPKMKNQNIQFVQKIDPAIGDFEVDVEMVRSALINILENGVEACIEDPLKKDHVVIFHVADEADFVIFGVQDNGVGMDQETLNNLFTLFFSTKGKSGTGFGLFISNKIIEGHGGKISVKSEPGQGSAFKITIPKIIPESVKTRPGK